MGARFSRGSRRPRGGPLAGALLAGMTLTAHAGAANQAAESAALNWVRAPRAESCPGPREVARAVEERLRRPALVPSGQAELTVEAFVAPLGEGFRVAIKLSRATEAVGQRVLEDADPDCGKVTSAAALAIALMIDPEATLDAPKADAPPSPLPVVPPAETRVERRPVPAAAPRREQQRPWQGDLELAGTVASGFFPRLAKGAYARGRVSMPFLPVALELQGGYFPKLEVEAKPGKGGRFELIVAGVSACSLPGRSSRITGSACAGAEVGSIAGRGYGFDDTPQFRTWVFTAAARARLWFRPRRGLAFATGPGVALPMRRDRFETYGPNERTQLFRVAPVELRFELAGIWEL